MGKRNKDTSSRDRSDRSRGEKKILHLKVKQNEKMKGVCLGKKENQ